MDSNNLFTIAQQIAELTGITKQGFEDIHRRQDVSNGRIGKTEEQIRIMQQNESFIKGKDNGVQLTWKTIVVSVSLFATILGIILTLAKVFIK